MGPVVATKQQQNEANNKFKAKRVFIIMNITDSPLSPDAVARHVDIVVAQSLVVVVVRLVRVAVGVVRVVASSQGFSVRALK